MQHKGLQKCKRPKFEVKNLLNLHKLTIKFRSLTSLAILVDLSPAVAQRPQTGSSGSRGSLLEQLRYYARDAEGLAGRALSPIEVDLLF